MKSTDIVLGSMFQYEVVGARGLDGQITVKRTTHDPLQLPSSDSQLQPSKKRPIQNRSGAEDEPSSVIDS